MEKVTVRMHNLGSRIVSTFSCWITENYTFEMLLRDATRYWSIPIHKARLENGNKKIWNTQDRVLHRLHAAVNPSAAMIILVAQEDSPLILQTTFESTSQETHMFDIQKELWSIFCYYAFCSSADMEYLKSQQFVRFLRDSELIVADNENFREAHANIVFVQASSGSKKMDFSQFLTALLHVSNKVYPSEESEDAFDNLLRLQVLPKAKRLELKLSTQLLEPIAPSVMLIPEISSIFQVLEPVLHGIFQFYVPNCTFKSNAKAKRTQIDPSDEFENNRYMSFSQFSRFTKDFSIASLGLSTQKLAQIFLACTNSTFSLLNNGVHSESISRKPSVLSLSQDENASTFNSTFQQIQGATFTIRATFEQFATSIAIIAFTAFFDIDIRSHNLKGGLESPSRHYSSLQVKREATRCVKALMQHIVRCMSAAGIERLVTAHRLRTKDAGILRSLCLAFKDKFHIIWENDQFCDYGSVVQVKRQVIRRKPYEGWHSRRSLFQLSPKQSFHRSVMRRQELSHEDKQKTNLAYDFDRPPSLKLENSGSTNQLSLKSELDRSTSFISPSKRSRGSISPTKTGIQFSRKFSLEEEAMHHTTHLPEKEKLLRHNHNHTRSGDPSRLVDMSSNLFRNGDALFSKAAESHDIIEEQRLLRVASEQFNTGLSQSTQDNQDKRWLIHWALSLLAYAKRRGKEISMFLAQYCKNSQKDNIIGSHQENIFSGQLSAWIKRIEFVRLSLSQASQKFEAASFITLTQEEIDLKAWASCLASRAYLEHKWHSIFAISGFISDGTEHANEDVERKRSTKLQVSLSKQLKAVSVDTTSDSKSDQSESTDSEEDTKSQSDFENSWKMSDSTKPFQPLKDKSTHNLSPFDSYRHIFYSINIDNLFREAIIKYKQLVEISPTKIEYISSILSLLLAQMEGQSMENLRDTLEVADDYVRAAEEQLNSRMNSDEANKLRQLINKIHACKVLRCELLNISMSILQIRQCCIHASEIRQKMNSEQYNGSLWKDMQQAIQIRLQKCFSNSGYRVVDSLFWQFDSDRDGMLSISDINGMNRRCQESEIKQEEMNVLVELYLSDPNTKKITRTGFNMLILSIALNFPLQLLKTLKHANLIESLAKGAELELEKSLPPSPTAVSSSSNAAVVGSPQLSIVHSPQNDSNIENQASHPQLPIVSLVSSFSSLVSRFLDYFFVIGPKVSRFHVDANPSTRPEDIILETQIIDKVPLQDHEGMNPPDQFSGFCFPTGIQFKTDPSKPIFFTFVLTDQYSTKYFAACLQFYEPAGIQDLIHLFVNSKESTSSISLPMWFDTQKNEKDPVVYQPKALCLLSHWPFFSAFREILTQLYTLLYKDTEVPIERYISNFMYEVPVPPPGQRSVQFSILNNITLKRPPENALPILDVPLRVLFTCLSHENVLALITSVLLEKKIVIYSSQISLLTIVTESIRALIFPFSLQCVYIPVLPDYLQELTAAPVPIILGMHTSVLNDRIYFEDFVHVKLETNEIYNCKVPKLPDARRKLLQALRTHANVYDSYHTALGTADSAFTGESPCFRSEDAVPLPPANEENSSFSTREVREAFLRFFVSVFGHYKSHLRLQSDAKQDENSTIRSNRLLHSKSNNHNLVFDYEGFIAEVNGGKEFVQQMTETQIFMRFIEERTKPEIQSLPEVKLFDKAIAAVQKERTQSILKRSRPARDYALFPITTNYQPFTAIKPYTDDLPRHKPNKDRHTISQREEQDMRKFPRLQPNLFGPIRQVEKFVQDYPVSQHISQPKRPKSVKNNQKEESTESYVVGLAKQHSSLRRNSISQLPQDETAVMCREIIIDLVENVQSIVGDKQLQAISTWIQQMLKRKENLVNQIQWIDSQMEQQTFLEMQKNDLHLSLAKTLGGNVSSQSIFESIPLIPPPTSISRQALASKMQKKRIEMKNTDYFDKKSDLDDGTQRDSDEEKNSMSVLDESRIALSRSHKVTLKLASVAEEEVLKRMNKLKGNLERERASHEAEKRALLEALNETKLQYDRLVNNVRTLEQELALAKETGPSITTSRRTAPFVDVVDRPELNPLHVSIAQSQESHSIPQSSETMMPTVHSSMSHSFTSTDVSNSWNGLDQAILQRCFRYSVDRVEDIPRFSLVCRRWCTALRQLEKPNLSLWKQALFFSQVGLSVRDMEKRAAVWLWLLRVNGLSHSRPFGFYSSLIRDMNDTSVQTSVDQLCAPNPASSQDLNSRNADARLAQAHLLKQIRQDAADALTITQDQIPQRQNSHESQVDCSEEQVQLLQRVLFAYSQFNPQVGYCRGINFLAAILLRVFNHPNGVCPMFCSESAFLAVRHSISVEEQVFWGLVSLLDRFGLVGYFQTGMPLLGLVLYQLDCLLVKHLPRLHHHLEEEQVSITTVASGWVITLFSSAMNLPTAALFRVWDLFLAAKWKILFRAVIVLLGSMESQILSLDFAGILRLLDGLKHQIMHIIESNAFIDAIHRTKVTTSELSHLEHQYNLSEQKG